MSAEFNPELDIENVQKVMEIFGRWPSFHDAEILKLTLEHGPDSPSLTCELYLFESTGESDSQGYYRLKNQAIVVLGFQNLDPIMLRTFTQQNVIYDLIIKRISEKLRFEVEFSESCGCYALFECAAITVSSVLPINVYP